MGNIRNSSSISTTARSRKTEKRQRNDMPLAIPGGVCLDEGVGGDYASDVAEADLPGGTNGAAVVAAEVHVEPADYYGHGAVGTHCDEEEAAVADVVVCADCELDYETGAGGEMSVSSLFGRLGLGSWEVGGGRGKEGLTWRCRLGGRRRGIDVECNRMRRR